MLPKSLKRPWKSNFVRFYSLLLTAFCLALPASSVAGGMPSEYYQIEDNSKQKEAFILHMKNLVDKSNQDILKDREFVTAFFDKAVPGAFRGLSQKNVGYLIALRNKYGIENLFDREEYYRRIDIVPPSMALAQAALESGWGKSRFAREANNLFGHWSFSGVGLVSQNKDVGKNQMIRIFSSLQKSVAAYMHNLNTSEAYSKFRERRYQSRLNNRVFTGMEASKFMINYSELKEEYIKMIREMIEQNNLSLYDQPTN